jgi:DNA polymerase-3 subunit alpha
MGKKIREMLIPHREKFVTQAVERGYTKKLAEDIFDLITPFADYGFNASHACAYALVGYQTAYLKAHHPTEYMAALLTSCKDDKDKKPFYLNACRLMGIEVLPPDVNQSQLDFTPVVGQNAVRYGLSAVRNVGAAVVQSIVDARARKGAFESFTDFCRKVDAGALHKKCLESLILAGAFDSMGYKRRALFESFEKVVTPILSDRRAEQIGQESFFGGGVAPALVIDESVLEGEEFERSQFLREEKGVLGQYVTDHPLLHVKDQLERQTDMPIVDLAALGDGDVVRIGGIVGAIARRYTKKGEPFAMFRLEDLAGGITVVAFPSAYEQAASLIDPDRILLVKGRVDLRGREMQIAASEITEPDLSVEPPAARRPVTVDLTAEPVIVDVAAESFSDGMLAKLKETLAAYPGEAPVVLRFLGQSGIVFLKVGDGYRVDRSESLLSELRHIFGAEHVRISALT